MDFPVNLFLAAVAFVIVLNIWDRERRSQITSEEREQEDKLLGHW